MHALLVSTSIVALAEIGDKTQLLALLLAARYGRGKALPIILGIFVATLFNHFAAAAIGQWVISQIGPHALRWILAATFFGMAAWTLVPDKLDDGETRFLDRFGVFGATFFAFFLAEMGDKTQIATVALAARFDDLPMVVAGTTLGMMIADVPAVFLGEAIVRKLHPKLVHAVTALIFAGLGVATLLY